MRVRAIALACCAILCAPARGGEGAPGGGRLILSEESVWRGHITWMPAVSRAEGGGLKPARVWKGLTHTSPLPPQDWTKVEFDDSSWFHWREPRAPKTLKGGSGVRLYDQGQYGIQRSVYMGLRCFRAGFRVEDPARVQDMTLSVSFRGGLAAYVNGREVGRAHLPKDGRLAPDTPADDHPEGASIGADGKALAYKPGDPETVRHLNMRVRTLQAKVPASALRKGVNVLALEIHRAPMYSGPKKVKNAGHWNACGLVAVELRANGAVEPAVSRPKGLQVWNANVLTRISPFGGTASVRIWAGAGARMQRFPLSWGPSHARLAAVRIAGARNGAFCGQVGVSSDAPIRGLAAAASELVRAGGAGRIPASAVQVLCQGYPGAYPTSLHKDPNTSLLDVLYGEPPAEVPVRAEVRGSRTDEPERGGLMGTWTDGGALTPVWIRVRVPADAPAGEYAGTLTIRAAGARETVVPVKLQVADWTVPQPRDFVTHVGAMHSPDTLARHYKVPLWSDAHFKLVEKTLAYTGELGGKVVYVPLVANATWLCNERSMVTWVKQGNGSCTYDFTLFDRYMDLVQKYLKPEVVCLYVTDGQGMCRIKGVSTPDGGTLPVPACAPKPESVAFWKPVIAQVRERLSKRGLGEAAMLGFLWEQNTGEKGKAAVELFKEAAPGLKLVQIAHYAGQKGQNYGTPFGYVMSVWGNRTPYPSKAFGARDIPIKVAWHPRADAVHDIRPFGPRGAFRTIPERSASGTIGVAPIGMDFWNLPGTGALEGAGAWNLSMCRQTTAALLAPGSDGPVSTVRFEMLREGLQECEARQLIEKALADAASKARIGDALAKRCRETLDERARAADFASRGEWGLEGEGWQWFSASDWEARTLRLFACAGEVARALGIEVKAAAPPASPVAERPAPAPSAAPESKAPEAAKPATKPAAPAAPAARRKRPSAEEVCRGWWSLAMSYKRAGRKDKAREYLQRIIAQHPDTDHAARARRELARL